MAGRGSDRHAHGMNGLAALVQTTLNENPFSGHLFVFRGRRGDLVKLLWFEGDGLCLLVKRLERGRFMWPSPADGAVTITPARLGYTAKHIADLLSWNWLTERRAAA